MYVMPIYNAHVCLPLFTRFCFVSNVYLCLQGIPVLTMYVHLHCLRMLTMSTSAYTVQVYNVYVHFRCLRYMLTRHTTVDNVCVCLRLQCAYVNCSVYVGLQCQYLRQFTMFSMWNTNILIVCVCFQLHVYVQVYIFFKKYTYVIELVLVNSLVYFMVAFNMFKECHIQANISSNYT